MNRNTPALANQSKKTFYNLLEVLSMSSSLSMVDALTKTFADSIMPIDLMLIHKTFFVSFKWPIDEGIVGGCRRSHLFYLALNLSLSQVSKLFISSKTVLFLYFFTRRHRKLGKSSIQSRKRFISPDIRLRSSLFPICLTFLLMLSYPELMIRFIQWISMLYFLG